MNEPKSRAPNPCSGQRSRGPKLGEMNRKKQNGGRECRGGIGDRPFAATAQPATHKWRPSVRTNNWQLTHARASLTHTYGSSADSIFIPFAYLASWYQTFFRLEILLSDDTIFCFFLLFSYMSVIALMYFVFLVRDTHVYMHMYMIFTCVLYVKKSSIQKSNKCFLVRVRTQ